MDKDKNSNLLANPAIIAAVIALCGTVITAALASPILLELIKARQATATPSIAAPVGNPVSFTTKTPPIIQPPTETSIPVPTNTEPPAMVPTNTELPTFTPIPTATPPPTLTFTPTLALPDLQIVAISNPACIRDQRVSPTRYYVRHDITVRNIGAGSTSAFGAFSIRITLDTGSQRYSLEEWASRFNGVVGSLILDFSNLGPNQDAETRVNIDLRGTQNYSLEVIANSGSKTIPESNATNNILTRSFSVTNCP